MAARKKKNEELIFEAKSKVYRIPRFIDESNVLTLTNKGWYIGDRKLSEDEVAGLRAEARDFKKSYLWQMMKRDIHYVAYLQSTNKRSTEVDAIYGGAMYRCLEILEKFVKDCSTSL